MSLAPIEESFLPYILKSELGQEIFDALYRNSSISVKGFSGSYPSLFIAKFFLSQKKTILYLIEDKEDCLYAVAELEEFLGKDHVLYFPPSHLEPYQVERVQNANLVLRTEVINRLNTEKRPKVIVGTFTAFSEKVLKNEDFELISHRIKVGDRLDFDFTQELLHQFQFSLVDFVSEPGQFSVRGGIVDVFSYSNEEPYRISFFGNEVESIKVFDINSQLSKTSLEELHLVSNMNYATAISKVPLWEILDNHTILITKNLYLGLERVDRFYEKAQANYSKLNKTLQHPSPEQLFISRNDFVSGTRGFKSIDFTTAPESINGDREIVTLYQHPQPIFHKNFEMLMEDIQEKRGDKIQVWISCSSEKQKERLQEIFSSLAHGKGANTLYKQEFTPYVSYIKSSFHEGFVDFKLKFAVYTDHQIFDRYHKFKPKNAFAKSEQLTLKDLVSLKVGDYITHIDHGIGKFLGLVKINNNGKIQECFKLTYKNNDLLYVSIHSLHKISKYNGPEGRAIQLNKLGSPTWKNLKNKTKAKVKQIAFDLIKLYAERKSSKGFAYAPDTYLQDELEASFIYEDTPDQEKATRDVKRDMEAETIMDRLVCGDVGFGKTEVAIRAAFKAATDGKQVAVLVPTTILAFQHYRSFQSRLKDFPVRVSFLNRFRSSKQKSETKAGLKDGSIDIVIGTHQLVGKDIVFKDLGLLIIDEEHKFGVNVKDKLKTLKSNIDTLTLTATPIPRTLQFSLMAARDLSVIKTPPPNRQPVETQIIGFQEELLRDAISYELQRDGQVYFINNRIENLQEIAGLIQRLVPDARVVTGHGQMEGKELETRILDFMEGKYDVLVSTTIVESGVDVPNANTIFINDAHRFGMADLHQMRGRVGRSNRKAFCYLITPPYDIMTQDARKRLEAIEQFSDLGSGFQIAMKDLEIRGAGDLLGAEQSGFISDMGFEAYQKIMQEALEELQSDASFEHLFQNEDDRKKLIKTNREVNIDTDLELMLPDSYVSSIEERLNLYQKLAEIEDRESLNSFKNELLDRFGAFPEQVENLLKSVELKWLASAIGFDKIVMKNDVFLGYFPANPQDKFYQSYKFKNIINYLSRHPKDAQLKEKIGKEGNQLMMRKDHVRNVNEVNQLLETILAS